MRSFIEYWEDDLPKEIEDARKFIQVLASLNLDLSDETKELKEIQRQLDEALESAKKGEAELTEFIENQGIGVVPNTDWQQGINATLDRLDTFRSRLDRRTLDTLAIISQSTASVRSEELFGLMTQEP